MDEKRIIDFHIHLIPEVDDGASSMDEALEMARALCSNQVELAVATSHYARGADSSGEEYISLVKRNYSLLVERLAEESIPLKVVRGFEVSVKEEMIYDVNIADLAIEGSNCILIEPPFSNKAPWLEDLVYTLTVRGLVPVLAHPERCQYFGGDLARLKRLSEEGAVLQLNLGSFVGIYGEHVRHAANEILRYNTNIVFGTDAHNAALISQMKDGIKNAGKKMGKGLGMDEALYGVASEILGNPQNADIH